MSSSKHMQGRVLIIDDDPMSRELVAMLLEAEGFLVEAVESGEAAVEHLQGGVAVDFVLADMQMPGLRGAELAGKLRTVCGGKCLLVAMSASEPSEAALVGFDVFMMKPFDGAGFRAVVSGERRELAKVEFGAAPVLDPVIFGKMRASMKPEQLRELYAICLEDSRRRIELMRGMNPKKDDARFKSEAHAIKGACSMLGAMRLAEIAKGLETGGMGGHDSVDATLNEFVHECEALEGILLSGGV